MLTGTSIIGSNRGGKTGTTFHGVNPATGEALAPQYFSATPAEIDHAARLAHDAFAAYSRVSGQGRAAFLRSIADGLEAASAELIDRAHQETGLPVPRLTGEVSRTSNQLRLFASVVEEGSWLMARIDTADAARKTQPKPQISKLLRPQGPGAVVGASNFPLAFSVAGGDTASALAAGNPVIVKAHPAHPGTSELVAQVIENSIRACGLPGGTFSLLFDAGKEAGTSLVQHPLVKAVGFTGSLAAGRALMDLAAARPEPIPCFAEMSSTNPVFILPGALAARGAQIAAGLFPSFTLGAGQFCTKPGLVFLPDQATTAPFVTELRRLVSASTDFTMLTSGIANQYAKELEQHSARLNSQTRPAEASSSSFTTQAVLRETDAQSLLADSSLAGEIFGPTTLLIHHRQQEEMLRAAESLQGHLTATLLGTEEDIQNHQELISILERKVGRLLFNGYPTGVEVCHAMVHGGPYPASSDGRFTSVGSQAIYRFTRPICYQDFPEAALPEELKSNNPLGILRMINGQMTSEPIPASAS